MTIPPERSGGILPSQSITTGGTNIQSGDQATKFKSYMQEAPQGMQKTPSAPSPGQIPQGSSMPQGASLETVLNQTATTQGSLSEVKTHLQNNNLKLTRSQQHLLRNKLSSASDHLRSVNDTLGVSPPEMPKAEGSGPINKFITYVNDGQNQLASANQQLSLLSKSGATLNPSDFLLIQIKMSKAQQEIEYSSTLLSKVVSSITQLLNTQL